jgi:hypothetical protein
VNNPKWTITLYPGSGWQVFPHATNLQTQPSRISFVDEQGRSHNTNLPFEAMEEK